MPQASAQRKFSDAITYMKVIDIFHSYIDGFRKPYIETADVGQFTEQQGSKQRKNMAGQSKIFLAGEINFSLPFLFIELLKWRCLI